MARESEFPGRVALPKSCHLAVLHDELVDVIRELRSPELETLDGNQLPRRSARKSKRKTASRLIEHLEFYFGWSYVRFPSSTSMPAETAVNNFEFEAIWHSVVGVKGSFFS